MKEAFRGENDEVLVTNKYPATSANKPMAIVGSTFQSLQSHPVGSTPPAWSRRPT
jgi:hypothetical protein